MSAGLMAAEPSAARAAGAELRASPLARRIVSLADADRNGTVSAEEWTTFLHRLDPGASGHIDDATLDSLLDERAESVGRTRGRSRDRMLVGRLLDQDRDGLMETAVLSRIFALLDADGDHALSRKELPAEPPGTQAAAGPRKTAEPAQAPALLLAQRADEDHNGEVTSAEWQRLVGRADADGNGTVAEGELAVALSGPAAPTARSDWARSVLPQLDSNGDGILERQELSGFFVAADRDADGILRADEWPALVLHARRVHP